MLDLLEKIGFGLGGLCILLTLAFYTYVGPPSTESVEFISKVRKKAEAPPPAGSQGSAPGSQPQTQEEQEILKKLQEQASQIVQGQRLQVEEMEVLPDLFEHVNIEANWTQELKKAHSTVIPTKKGGPSRLKVHQIAENSLLKHFGIQENDVIELINGEVVQFSQTSSQELYRRAKTLLQSLRDGGSISVTVSRNNRPVHLKFALGQ
jgi:hypothetical protein